MSRFMLMLNKIDLKVRNIMIYKIYFKLSLLYVTIFYCYSPAECIDNHSWYLQIELK